MAYTPTTWVNDSQPAISAENLNNIESGISALDTLAGSTDISAIGDGTITGAIGTTDISSVGDGTVTGAISTLNSSLNTQFKVVRTNNLYCINSGSLTNGSYGYITTSVTIPTGYKTMGIAAVGIGHPSAASCVSISCGMTVGLTGTFNIYPTYMSMGTVNYAATDFVVSILCIKSDAEI